MAETGKRYEKRGSLKPCTLNPKDILQLAELVGETYTGPEKARFFRVSTNLGQNRVFFNSIEELLAQPELAPRITDLSFWIEGWNEQTRFDKNVLLDLSKYSVRLNVEGTDPVWVYDKYARLTKYLSTKTSWYWPIILMEKFLIFFITLLLIVNLIIAISYRKVLYLDKLGLLAVWIFLVFYDTRQIWPYANLRVRESRSAMGREDLLMAGILLIIIAALVSGTFIPLLK